MLAGKQRENVMRRFLMMVALVTMAMGPARAEPGDVKGSSDYPGIGRFAGSVISGYKVKDFDAARIQAAPFVNGAAKDQRDIEGKVYQIAYRTDAGPSIVEVFRNFKNAASKAGYATLLECETDVCGGIPFAEKVDTLPLPAMWLDGFNFRYLSAHKPATADSSESFFSVAVSENNSQIYAQVIVVEVDAMDDKMIDAAAMAKGLADAGHIALYGIYFDTGKAIIKPTSRPTLVEIAALLNGDPSLKTVYIVGHTDSQGSYDMNMDLSRRRAEAIAAELAASFGVAPGRLKTAGIGFLSPVGSNATEAGRALNRRTELVVP